MSTKQMAEINNDGSVLQVAGNYYSRGLTYDQVKDLFLLLLDANLPKLEAAAAEKARAYAEDLVRKTYERLSQKIAIISTQKLAEPNVQAIFNEAIQNAARKGEKANIDLLADLLEMVVENDNSDFLDICIEVAISIVPKLTKEMLCAVATIQFVQHLTVKDENSLEQVYKALYDEFTSKCEYISITKLMTISSFGAGSYMNITGMDTFNEFKKKYTVLTGGDSKERFPFLTKVLGIYDKQQMHKLSLNAPGKVIAVTLLKKIFPALELKMLIE